MMKSTAVSPHIAQRKALLRIVLTALFGALTAAGNFIAIPLPGSPVPIVLQNMFALLSGLVLGPYLGGAAVGLYLLAGALGAPVFAGASGGFVRFFGPTGGFLLGYPLIAIAAGAIAGRPKAEYKTPTWRLAFAIFAGMLIVYVPGIIRLKFALDDTWQGAMLKGCAPFIPGDAVKGVLAGLIAPRMRRVIADHLDG
ncbi:MAG: biotin transporter BioY [Spirochaetaceae bacterium]|jgi:biotin transport system substrate-specific component|nr:biotin transporter BioY [Spirochaetaceae bacterium]